MNIYAGPLDMYKMPQEALRAYRSWSDQRKKCNNRWHKDYKYYGAKGVRVIYSSREFVSWWLENISRSNFKCPTIGRLNHAGNYEFGNIEIQERVENSRERIRRCGHPMKINMKRVLCMDSGAPLMSFFTSQDAAKHFGKSTKAITSICQGANKYLLGTKISFKYYPRKLRMVRYDESTIISISC